MASIAFESSRISIVSAMAYILAIERITATAFPCFVIVMGCSSATLTSAENFCCAVFIV
jgi:hypothetical protein